MATIYDRGDSWHLVISPGAKPVQNIDEPQKGYSATLGEDDTGKHVVMDVHYSKDKYTLNDVSKFVEKTRTCPKCTALDKEKMNLSAIELQETPQPPQVVSMGTRAAEPVIQRQQLSPLKDVFANVFFDAYLTNPGKYFLGMMLNDDKILESSMPKDQRDIPQFMDEMVDFLSGKIEFVRSPDEVKEYLSVLRSDDEDTKQSQRNIKKKKKGINTQAVIIY